MFHIALPSFHAYPSSSFQTQEKGRLLATSPSCAPSPSRSYLPSRNATRSVPSAPLARSPTKRRNAPTTRTSRGRSQKLSFSAPTSWSSGLPPTKPQSLLYLNPCPPTAVRDRLLLRRTGTETCAVPVVPADMAVASSSMDPRAGPQATYQVPMYNFPEALNVLFDHMAAPAPTTDVYSLSTPQMPDLEGLQDL